MIGSDKPSKRYDAVEWMRISQDSSPDMVYALQKATLDGDKEVSDRATLALQADAHHQMMIKMGLIQQDGFEGNTDGEELTENALDQSSNNTTVAHDAMLRSLKSNGYWLLGLGVLHIILSGRLSASWGVLLIIVGIASFIFHSASMFIIYGITLIWASISNIIGFSVEWMIFAFVQIYFAVTIFMAYRKYHKVEKEYLTEISQNNSDSISPDRSSRIFPWIGSAFGCLSLLGFVMVFLAEILIAILNQSVETIPNFMGFLERLFVNMGVLGLAIGLASLLSRYRPKALGIVALVAGVLTLLINLGLRFL